MQRLVPGPRFYALALILVAYFAFVAHMRANGIFSCPAQLYRGEHYLGHCESTAYGDYDHGAFWFDLEPTIRHSARAADVLFVGNSRMQFGLSAPALGRWFASQDRSYYLLGFSHGENVNFLRPLLRELKPSARVYVVDADEFFVTQWTGPARDVVQGKNTLARYRAKRGWQRVHHDLCGRIPSACGNTMAFFRQRETGEWLLAGRSVGEASGVERIKPLDEDRVARLRLIAADFVAELNVRPECVIFTYVPPKESDRPTMQALAATLEVPFVSPQLDGLLTFDGSHLDRPSAQRFTAAFVEEAGPLVKRCLGDGAAAPRVTSEERVP